MNEPFARGTAIQLVSAQVAEVRLDIQGGNQGKLRLGLVLTIATVVVTASGWPPVDIVQKALYLVLIALPCTGVGVGLVVDELMQARADRRGRRRADDREVAALRARIVADGKHRNQTIAGAPRRFVGPVEEVTRRTPSRPVAATPPGRRRLIGGPRAAAPFRTGFLGLR